MQKETSSSGGKDVPVMERDDGGRSEEDASTDSRQAGVKKAEMLRKNMSKRDLTIAYVALFVTMFASRFSVYSALVYGPYATSSFSQHSLLSAAGVVADITQLCAYPIIAKLGDVIGRAEGFLLAAVLMAVASAMYAGSPNIETYLAAGIFSSLGDTGLLLTEQVFIAETTSLANRGLLAALPESIGGIVALFAGSVAADAVLARSTWRWGYGMWAIVVPACAAPLVVVMFVLERRAARAERGEKSSDGPDHRRWRGLAGTAARFVWTELDLLGALLLVAGLALILLPLSLTGSGHTDRWSSPSLIAMLVVGAVSLVAFGVWDGRFAAKPIVPLSLMRRLTLVAACLLGALDFLSYSAFGGFFPSYLQVVPDYSPAQASLVSNSLIVAYQATRILTGVGLRLTRRTQPWILAGVPLCILGQGLMIHLAGDPPAGAGGKASFVVSKVLVGVGRGLYHTASLVSVQAVVSRQELSVATSLFLALMTVGAAIGESIGGAVWRHSLMSNLTAYLPASVKPDAATIFGSIVAAKAYDRGSLARDAIDASYRSSMRLLAIVATALMVPMLPLMFFIQPVKLSRKSEEAEEGDNSR